MSGETSIPSEPRPPGEPGNADGAVADDESLATATEALAAARERLLAVPADLVVVNHAMGLYELAAIHLTAPEPDLGAASLAIDALSGVIDAVGDRLGPEAETLNEALATIRLAFVQVSRGPQGPE